MLRTAWNGVLYSARTSRLWSLLTKRLLSTTATTRFKGIFVPLVTPFEGDSEALAVDRLRSNLAKWNSTPLHGYVVMGSNGEFPLLGMEEKRRLLEVVAAEGTKASKLLIAGTGSCGTRETIELTKSAASMGYHAAMVVTPYYYGTNITQDVLKRHYTEIADRSPIPIILYNVPPFSGVRIANDTVDLLSTHPNIVGIKDTTGSIVNLAESVQNAARNRQLTQQNKRFVVLAGGASSLLYSLLAGGSGGILALANILPGTCCRLFELATSGKLAEAASLQNAIVRINELVTAKHGVAGLKAAMDLLGYYGGPPRRPFTPASDAVRNNIKECLHELAAGGVTEAAPPRA